MAVVVAQSSGLGLSDVGFARTSGGRRSCNTGAFEFSIGLCRITTGIEGADYYLYCEVFRPLCEVALQSGIVHCASEDVPTTWFCIS